MFKKNIYKLTITLIIAAIFMNLAFSKNKFKYQQIKIDNLGRLQFRTPADWKMQPTHAKGSDVINYQLIPEKTKDLMILITPFISPDKKPIAKNIIVQKLIEEGNKLLEISKETELEFKTIKTKRLICYYYGLTDASTRPGKFNYLIRGGIKISNLLVSISIFTNNDNYTGIDKALKMIKSFKHYKK